MDVVTKLKRNMFLQEMAFKNLERQLIKKLENFTDPYNENNFICMKFFVKYMKDVKKLIHKEFKTICKTAKDVPLTRLTRDWIKEVR